MSHRLVPVSIIIVLAWLILPGQCVLAVSQNLQDEAPFILFPSSQPEIKITLQRGGSQLYAPVKINGQDVGHFRIDTGATASFVDPEISRSLKLSKGRKTGEVTAGGFVGMADLAQIDSLSIGQFNVGPHEIAVKNSVFSEKQYGLNVCGLLGNDVLHKVPFSIDYRTGTLTFYDPSRFTPPAKDHAEEIVLKDQCPYVKGRFKDGSSAILLIDTGMPMSLTLPAHVWKNNPLFDSEVHTAVSTVTSVANNAIKVSRGRLSFFNIFGHEFNDYQANYMESNQDYGVLGGEALKDFFITYDYTHQRLWAKYCPLLSMEDIQDKNFDTNKKDFYGETCLNNAIRDQRLDMIEALLAKGVDVNSKNIIGQTPLMFAVNSDSGKAVELLLSKKADPNDADRDGGTALMVAVHIGSGDLAKILLARGADVNAKNKGGNTALVQAVEKAIEP